MNIYFVNRYSKLKGPFDIIDSNRQHIIKVGDICLRDYVEGVAFLVVCSSENSWNACKRVGIGDNGVLTDQGNTLLFSFDGLHRRKGNAALIKQFIDCYREKVIVDFFSNAIEILEYKKDFWDVSLFQKFFATSQELITRSIPTRPSEIQNNTLYPSEFAKYLDKELLGMLIAGLNTGNGLKAMYEFLREKEPMLFRTALMKFLAENPTGTIYDKPTYKEITEKPKEEIVPETPTPSQEEKPHEAVATDEEDQSFLLNDFNSKEFRKLFNRYHKGDKKAFELLVKANIKLVTGLARTYKDYGVEYDDLVQEGTIGLMRAIERFNPNRKVPFPAYAKWWIHQSFVQALIDMQSIVKIPANQVSLYKKVRKSIERYEQEHGYKPSPSEIEIEDDLAPENIEYLSNLPDRLHELTTRSNDWDELPGSDSADDLLMKESQTHFIDSILRKLKNREAYILRHLYGIGEKSETLSDIGERLGLTRERVRQIAEKGVRNLRVILRLRKATEDEEEDSPEQEESKPIVESKSKPKRKRKDPDEKATPRILHSPFIRQEKPAEKDISVEKPDTQYEVNEKDGLKIGDNINYNNRFCTVRKIIENGKSSKLVVEYSNGVQDFVAFDKSRFDKVTPAKESYPKEDNHEESEPSHSYSSSTSLNELVGLRIITRKQLKHCHKRNLRTIGDVQQIIEQYHLTPDSSRFTQYTIDMWFSIVGLLNPKDVTKGKAKGAEDDVEHVYVDIPTAAPYIETEVPVRDARTGENKPIDTKKLDTVFDNKSTSYKYFWFMAIISLAKKNHSLSLTYKDILIRMVALAWPIVMDHELNLGKQDMLGKYLWEIVRRTSLVQQSPGRYVEFLLDEQYNESGIDRILSPLLNNVPYRFLSPWVKYTTNNGVSETSKSDSFDGLYALYSNGIVLNSMWWQYINDHYQEICDFSIRSFIGFVLLYNDEEQIKKLKMKDWILLKEK